MEILPEIGEILKYIAAIPVVFGGIVAMRNYDEYSATLVEGEIVKTDFTDDRLLRARVRTEEGGDLELIFETEKLYDISLITLKKYPRKDLMCWKGYRGKAAYVRENISVGDSVSVRVHEKKGIQRTVHEILDSVSQ